MRARLIPQSPRQRATNGSPRRKPGDSRIPNHPKPASAGERTPRPRPAITPKIPPRFADHYAIPAHNHFMLNASTSPGTQVSAQDAPPPTLPLTIKLTMLIKLSSCPWMLRSVVSHMRIYPHILWSVRNQKNKENSYPLPPPPYKKRGKSRKIGREAAWLITSKE